MKIDTGSKPAPAPAAGNRTAQSPGRADVRVPQAGAGQTKVELSTRVADLRQLEARLAAIPVVNRERVESIKTAIANGEYIIKPENIATGLIESVKEMVHVVR